MTSHPRYDLITLGETMLRLVPPGTLRLGQSGSLDLSFGGAESNVAANLARLGRRVSWWSRLPDNPLGHQLAGVLRSHGVDTGDVLYRDGERLGVYFIEYGTDPRGIRVLYDRANSAASHMRPADVPDAWLASGRWLHLTGITPALSDTCRATVQHAIDTAKANGASVSFDVNYRALLWPPDAAGSALAPFCAAADVVFVALRDAHNLFGAAGDAQTVASTLQAKWGGTLIVTDGDSGAAACDGADPVFVPALPATVIDRIGAGDAFASGVIDRLLDGLPLTDALRYGAALAALKLSIPGDIAQVTRAEVDALLEQSGAGLHR